MWGESGEQPPDGEIVPGQRLPSLVKRPTIVQLVRYAAATQTWHRIHYDREFAMKDGLPGVVVQGVLLGQFLAQMLTDWVGDGGFLRKLEWRNVGFAILGDVLTCHGEVTEKSVVDDDTWVRCLIGVRNQDGKDLAVGTATVVFPPDRT